MHLRVPTLLLDRAKCMRNIAWMAEKARRCGVAFRPHFKTHQSHAIGRWFRDAGVDRITVSSVRMARYFASDGWNDVTIAFPLNVLELEDIRNLAASVRLNVLVVEGETIPLLSDPGIGSLGVYIKIDTGYGRTGIGYADMASIDALIDAVGRNSRLQWKGFITHAGNAYKAQTREEVLAAETDSIGRMRRLKEHYRRRFPSVEISIGDTPGCSVVDAFDDVDEIRPGNFVFYDAMQEQIGSCTADRIAVAMVCPVVAVHRGRNAIIMYGGAVHLSKDFIRRSDGAVSYGSVVRISDKGWSEPIDGAYVSSLSQEHGVVSAPAAFVRSVKPGDIIGVLPVHSCLTADCMGGYLTLDSTPIDHMQARSMDYFNNS